MDNHTYGKNFVKAKKQGKLCSAWGFDSEFLMSGRVNAPEDVQSVQFSNGVSENTVVLENAGDLKDWLIGHRFIESIVWFRYFADLGSIEELLGSKPC